jgi:hypothetical protein
MSSTEDHIKDKIDKGAEKAKDATEKVADKVRMPPTGPERRLKNAGEKVKHSTD